MDVKEVSTSIGRYRTISPWTGGCIQSEWNMSNVNWEIYRYQWDNNKVPGGMNQKCDDTTQLTNSSESCRHHFFFVVDLWQVVILSEMNSLKNFRFNSWYRVYQTQTDIRGAYKKVYFKFDGLISRLHNSKSNEVSVLYETPLKCYKRWNKKTEKDEVTSRDMTKKKNKLKITIDFLGMSYK